MAELFDRQTTREGPGVYGLYCAETGKWYIGASKTMVRRIKDHYYFMRTWEGAMSQDYHRYGEESMPAYVLERIADLSTLDEREIFWFEKLKGDAWYNVQHPGRNRYWKLDA